MPEVDANSVGIEDIVYILQLSEITRTSVMLAFGVMTNADKVLKNDIKDAYFLAYSVCMNSVI